MAPKSQMQQGNETSSEPVATVKLDPKKHFIGVPCPKHIDSSEELEDMSSGDHTQLEMTDPRFRVIDPNRKKKQNKRREPVASSEQVSAEADSATKDKQASSSSSGERWLAAGLYDLLSKRPRPDDDLVVEDKSAK
jgi:hypothetical protein